MKRSLLASLAVAAFSVVTSAVAVDKPEPKPHELSVTTDRAEPFYDPGETVTFTITLTENGEPVQDGSVKWRISKDGLDPALKEGVTTLVEGSVVVTGELDEPGFLQCRADVSIPGASVSTGRAAAAILPEQIGRSMPPPDDFDEFWNEQKNFSRRFP